MKATSALREAAGKVRSFSFTDVNPVALGVVTVVMAVAAATFAFAVGSLGLLDNTYTMSGVFESSGGIRSGDKVRLAGVEVGKITSVQPDFDQGYVVVTWEVDSGIEVSQRAEAEVSLATLLGGRYLRLDGPRTEPFMEDLPEEQRRIPLERTRLPYDVQEALGDATTTLSAIDAETIDDLVNQMADLASDNASSFEPLLEDVSVLAETLNQRKESIDLLLDQTNMLTSTLADKDQALLDLIDHAGNLLDEVAKRRDQLHALLGSGSDAVGELDRLISANRQSLDAILSDLVTTTSRLEPRLPELNETLAYLGPALDSLESATITDDWLDVLVTGLSVVQITEVLDLLGGR